MGRIHVFLTKLIDSKRPDVEIFGATTLLNGQHLPKFYWASSTLVAGSQDKLTNNYHKVIPGHRHQKEQSEIIASLVLQSLYIHYQTGFFFHVSERSEPFEQPTYSVTSRHPSSKPLRIPLSPASWFWWNSIKSRTSTFKHWRMLWEAPAKHSFLRSNSSMSSSWNEEPILGEFLMSLSA